MKRSPFLAALLALSILIGTACTADTPTDTKDTTEVTTAIETTVAETAEYTAPDVNYDGKTITIASYDYDDSYVILNYNVTMDEENADVINDAIVKRNRQVEEELGVELALFPLAKSDRGTAKTIETLILAGEDAIQIALPMNAGIATMLTTENMVLDMKQIPTLDLSKSWWNQSANEEYTIYGRQLAAVGDVCFFNLGAPIVTYFSKALIKDNKMEDPYQLVREGKWTQDKLIEMATAAARDLNADGTMTDEDQFGFIGESESVVYWLMCSDVRLSERDKDGNITIAVDTERTVNTIDRLLPFFTNTSVGVQLGKTTETYASFHGDYAIPKLGRDEALFMTFQLLGILNMRETEADFGILPTPKYDEAQESYISYANFMFSDHAVLPSTNGDPAMVGHVLDALGHYAKEYITPAFIDKSVLYKAIRDEDSAEMLELIFDTQTFDVAFIFNWGQLRSTIGNMIYQGKTSFTTEYAKIREKVQSELNATLTQMKG